MLAYLKLAPWIIAAAAIVGFLYIRGSLANAETRAAKLQAQYEIVLKVNADNVRALDQLTKSRALDAQVIGEFSAAVDKIDAISDDLTSATQELELNNADVRSYLAGELPPELKRLYNGP